MLLLYSNVGGGGKFVDRKPVDYSYYFHINYTHNSVRKKYSTTIRIWRLPALGGVPIFKPRLITNCEREEAANGNYYFAN